jgi:hypothetical protein
MIRKQLAFHPVFRFPFLFPNDSGFVGEAFDFHLQSAPEIGGAEGAFFVLRVWAFHDPSHPSKMHPFGISYPANCSPNRVQIAGFSSVP